MEIAVPQTPHQPLRSPPPQTKNNKNSKFWRMINTSRPSPSPGDNPFWPRRACNFGHYDGNPIQSARPLLCPNLYCSFCRIRGKDDASPPFRSYIREYRGGEGKGKERRSLVSSARQYPATLSPRIAHSTIFPPSLVDSISSENARLFEVQRVERAHPFSLPH